MNPFTCANDALEMVLDENERLKAQLAELQSFQQSQQAYLRLGDANDSI